MDLGSRKVELWTASMAPDPDLYEVAARVATIPDTAAAVVRFANSAYVGAVYPVGTVLEAVIRVGCRSVGALAMASLNRELVDTWGAPELWEESLVVGRAAKLVGRLLGFSRAENEQLFVAGLFSAAGTAALLTADEGFLGWRRRQWMKGASDQQMLKREKMAYGADHVEKGSKMLAEWNLPAEIIATVASHHDPQTKLDGALAAAMSAPFDDSATRCLDMSLKGAMKRIGLGDHVSFVESEARLFADAAVQVFSEVMKPEMDVASQW
ncbi:MAG: HDOD domain-containing protein [Acidimicrobiia bacterium]|nr:HDOD domain-containing protein [Acidimicrobiia bacterium]MDH4309978.1 HDOD domain-containing protein [Acidimicrobiia bacterium]MDH5292786.1 HDOD domain-containing protein [Acidimicrobiia bacterium]